MSNVVDLTIKRRLKNMQKSLDLMEEQLKDIKTAMKALQKHVEYKFFNIACHELNDQRKKLLQNIIELKLRMDKYKNGDLE